jgi:hypothetical protein
MEHHAIRTISLDSHFVTMQYRLDKFGIRRPARINGPNDPNEPVDDTTELAE